MQQANVRPRRRRRARGLDRRARAVVLTSTVLCRTKFEIRFHSAKESRATIERRTRPEQEPCVVLLRDASPADQRAVHMKRTLTCVTVIASLLGAALSSTAQPVFRGAGDIVRV